MNIEDCRKFRSVCRYKHLTLATYFRVAILTWEMIKSTLGSHTHITAEKGTSESRVEKVCGCDLGTGTVSFEYSGVETKWASH